MIEYLTYDTNGQITQSGVCQPEMLDLQGDPIHTAVALPGASNLSGINWFDPATSTVHPIPAQPDEFHELDWTTKQWVIPTWALNVAKAQRKSYIDEQRDLSLATGTVGMNGSTFQVDRVSVANITSVVVACSAGVPLPPGFTWRTADNRNVVVTLQDLVYLGGLAMAYTNAQYNHAWNLKSQIDAATDLAGVLKIVW